MTKKLCVIGGGYWGANHVKTLFELGNLGAIVETEEVRLKNLLINYPVKGYLNLEAAIKDGYDGYIVATPAATHYQIGKRLLEKGLNVLLEKPMTLSAKDA